jgi:Holliday junction resolvase-like predicted endonuclease
MKRICKYCKKEFEAKTRGKKYCSNYCNYKDTYKPIHKQKSSNICIICQKVFYTKNKNTKYCSKKCKQENNNYMSIVGFESKTSLGAYSELLISCDLMNKGYDVFRSLSPSAKVDLIIRKNKKIHSIEVRTGRYTTTGRITYSMQNINANIMAVCIFPTKEIKYYQKVEQKWNLINIT